MAIGSYDNENSAKPLTSLSPPHHRKATALGEVPGRARRLQTAAKALRTIINAGDRAVIGSEVVALMEDQFDIKRQDLLPTDQIKDLLDRQLLYLSGTSSSLKTFDSNRLVA